MNKARAGGAETRVVYGEGEHPRIIRAAYQMREEGIGTPVLLGEREVIESQIRELGLDFAPRIITPHLEEHEDRVQALLDLRRRRGMTATVASALLQQPTWYGLMMVHTGAAEVFLSGLTQEYPDVLRPSLQIFGTAPGARVASGLYLMIVEDRSYVFTDTTVNIAPDAETLADIAVLGADFARSLDFEPRVAMLSFSNFGSTPHPLSHKVRDAAALVRQRRPDLLIDGEMQADTAVVDAIVNERFPFSEVRDANVLVFPDLGSANIAYKLLNRMAGVEAIGPVLLGMGEPVQVLQASDDVDDIVAMTAVAVMDAQARQAARN
ncbi:MAG: phosphate acyltransferase [Anaerolineaceae bacterium]|nr:phosphate acyltransferase [Anaerolineaceae bacterium]MDE0327851.1 phosphate acyltransferase [Anaerolineaceae bacterium]